MGSAKTQPGTSRTSRTATDTKPVRAAVYVRISQDREGAGGDRGA
jgi:hypothetical protein